jgi:hypothetical protein
MQHHEMIKDTIGENYFGPVRELLTSEPDRLKRVGKSLFIMSEHSILTHVVTVDLGCGNGIW